jgi:two-component system, OmpR family, response regulator MtrA
MSIIGTSPMVRQRSGGPLIIRRQVSRCAVAAVKILKIVDLGGRAMSAKVLVVDDDQATRDGLKQILVNGGFDAITAATFQEAVQTLRAADPDLLIVDVRLGEYNGLQLIITTERKIPAIVMTGYADKVVEDEAHQEGAEYLLKPIEPSALLALVRRMLSDSQETGTNGAA